MTHAQAVAEARRVADPRATVERTPVLGLRKGRKFWVCVYSKSGNLIGQGPTYEKAIDEAAEWRYHLDTDQLIRENERREDLDG